MKTAATTALLTFGLAAGSPAAAPLTSLERQRLAAHMDMTAGWLADEVRGLSAAQLDFRQARDKWSILEVVEHLVISADAYWRDLQDALRTKPGQPERLGLRNDADILWYGIDRTERQTAIAAETPKGKLRDLGSGLDAYRKFHAQRLQYAKTTADDLRGRLVPREGCDAYQWLLLISTHEQRHILQIREIKAAPGFPAR